MSAQPISKKEYDAIFSDRNQFLSATNPLATSDQREAEALAIRIFQTPEVQRAKHEVCARWLKGRKATPEAMQTFDDAIADYVFICALNAAISDTNNPKVLLAQCEPHRWFGLDVNGSRRGGNNADNAYRHVTAGPEGHYEILGKISGKPPGDVTFTLIGNTAMSKTLVPLELRKMDVDADGYFRITYDPSPANGRKNHMQTSAEAKYVFVRDSMTDWTQIPHQLVVRRLDPDGKLPVSFEEMVRRAVQYAHDDSDYYQQVVDFTLPYVNDMLGPFNAGKYGGLVSQSGAVGYINLRDDEALVINFTMADAAYMAFHAHDPWWRTIPFARHTSSLNNAQVAYDKDGGVTLVVAVKDPGVHNWIDTAGLHEGVISFRWQGLPIGQEEKDGPQIRMKKLVKLSELKNILPPETKYVTTQERAAQQAARTAAYAERWRDS